MKAGIDALRKRQSTTVDCTAVSRLPQKKVWRETRRRIGAGGWSCGFLIAVASLNLFNRPGMQGCRLAVLPYFLDDRF